LRHATESKEGEEQMKSRNDPADSGLIDLRIVAQNAQTESKRHSLKVVRE